VCLSIASIRSRASVGLKHRPLVPPLRVLQSPGRVRGIGGNHLAYHHPIEEHAHRGQLLLHCRPGVQLELRLDKRRHMLGSVTRLMARLPIGVSPSDPIVFLVVASVLLQSASLPAGCLLAGQRPWTGQGHPVRINLKMSL
jgi:hypothetical protein